MNSGDSTSYKNTKATFSWATKWSMDWLIACAHIKSLENEEEEIEMEKVRLNELVDCVREIVEKGVMKREIKSETQRRRVDEKHTGSTLSSERYYRRRRR